MIANHRFESSDQPSSHFPPEVMLPAAVCALALAAMLFIPTGKATAEHSTYATQVESVANAPAVMHYVEPLAAP
jgi:hypothetical protein